MDNSRRKILSGATIGIIGAGALITPKDVKAQTQNSASIVYSTDIAFSVNSHISAYSSQRYDVKSEASSGAFWIKSGEISPDRAGEISIEEGAIYDQQGHEYVYAEEKIHLSKLGAKPCVLDDTGSVIEEVDTTNSIQAIFNFANGRPVHASPGVTYAISAAIRAEKINAVNYDASYFPIANSGVNHQVYDATKSIKVIGGKYHAFNHQIIDLTVTKKLDLLHIEEAHGDGKGRARGMVLIKPGAQVKTVIIRNNICENYTKAGFDLNVSGDIDGNEVYINNNIINNIISPDSNAFAIRVGDKDALRGGACFISGNRITNVKAHGIAEAKGILCYGHNPKIHNNFISKVRNDGGDDAEGIYTKCMWGQIYSNTLHNAGHSHDGCIQIKGEEKFSSIPNSPDAGTNTLVFGNTVVFTDNSYDAPGIKCDKSSSQIYGNNVYDMRSDRGNKKHSVGIAFSDSEPGNHIQVFGNNITGFKYGLRSEKCGEFNQVHNNSVFKCTHTGISITSMSSTTNRSVYITENIFNTDGIAGDTGIVISSGEKASIYDIKLLANTINGFTTGIAINHSDAISLDNINVQNNTFMKTPTACSLKGKINNLLDGNNHYSSHTSKRYSSQQAEVISANRISVEKLNLS